MWKKFLILTYFGLILFIPPSFCQNNKANIDERFIGTWEARAGGFREVTTIQQDGTWVSESHCPSKQSPDISTGSWEVKDNKIIWTYDKNNIIFRTGEKDINPILEVTKDKFVLKETDGLITTYKRIDDNKKE
jgi:hypothetical protein